MTVVIQRILIVLFCLAVSVGAAADISATDYFKSGKTLTAQISPDGKFVATIAQQQDNQELVLWDTEAGSKRVLIDLASLTPRDASIRFIRWIGSEHIVAQFMEVKKGVKNLLDTKPAYRLLIIEISAEIDQLPKIFEVRTPGWLVHALPVEGGKFLYAKSGIHSKIYKIDASKLNVFKKKAGKLVRKDGGQFTKRNEVASVEGYAIRWFFSGSGQPESVLYFNEGKINLSIVVDGAAGEPIKSWAEDEIEEDPAPDAKHGQLIPIARSGEADTYFCLDIDAETDHTVYKCNFATGEESIVYRSDGYNIIDIILGGANNELVGVKVLREGKLERQYIDGVTRTKELAPSSLNATIGSSLDGSVELYYHETHDQPGRYGVRRQTRSSDMLVGSKYPHLDGRLQSRQYHERINVEGLEIPYLLTLPEGKGPYPLIVMPHGGPIGVFDDRYFDLYTQFFVANGYAVLRVNYRGSSGYSTELEEAGTGQWGHLILDDIYQATQAVSKRSDISAAKICSVGMSYGGYASLMMTIRHQDLFRCAVSVAGVTDVNLYLNSPYATKTQDAWLQKKVGDTVRDYEALKNVSPVYLAKDINRPIYILHGEEDKVVDVEHMYRMNLMLSKYNKDYEWRSFPDMGHGPEENVLQVEMFNSILSFLDKNI
ncbi:prolyl oligopeptidase family serine peptidase [Microbulbifer sp. OS29]|uniref:Prolyl oligopeptidase family serine peptidase n=1 Tax=Microbulbifer okhotskensis TaxID=2926617 RepID=A0A9X2ENL7_9GAMM|nr:prolyl oligopeptidase family serine peptidase [Microbulbifer okhotskensis]MCO1335522.1 prolyl oligopeptidase family serine peptidase [Microbulbifer okhotskensis]